VPIPSSSGGLPRALILTALQLEYVAVKDMARTQFEEFSQDGLVCEIGKFPTNNPRWELALVEAGRGEIEASNIAQKGICLLRPDAVLVVGVAGGVKDVRTLDVVAATKVYDYASGKEQDVNGGVEFFPRPEFGSSSDAFIQRARAEAKRPNWLKRTGRENLGTTPKVFVEPIATGPNVVSSKRGSVYERIKKYFSDAVAIDMESRAVLRAAYSWSIDTLAVRGISDVIEGKEGQDAQGGQPRAAMHAAAFALETLSNYTPQFIRMTTPDGTPSILRTVKSSDANEILRELSAGVASYWYKGQIGRYPRTAAAANLVAYAKSTGGAPELQMHIILIDPAPKNSSVNRPLPTRLYAEHQRAMQAASGSDATVIWTERHVVDQILATVIRLYMWKGRYPNLDVEIRFLDYLVLQRIDLSPKMALVTRDNPVEPMLVCTPGSALYQTYKDEIDISRKQSRALNSGVAGIPPTELSEERVLRLLSDLDVGVQTDVARVSGLLNIVKEETPPYGRPALGPGLGG